jgi:hypothetical protein
MATLFLLDKRGENVAKKTKTSDGLYCRKCQKIKAKDKYYEATSFLDTNGYMSICKDCCNELYEMYFRDYQDMAKAIYRMCKLFDICFSYEALTATKSHIEKIVNNGKSPTTIFGFYKSKLSTTGKQNGIVNLGFDSSDSLIASEDGKMPNTDYNYKLEQVDIGPELVEKWGNIPKQDIIFLENQYIDWQERYDINSKAMELIVKEICYEQLSIKKKREVGQSANTELKLIQELMNSAALKPIQESGAMGADNQTLGLWIQKFENEKPIPEVDEEFRDVDKIWKYIRIYFLGHLCKMLSINNEYSKEYEDEMMKYQINLNPESTDEEEGGSGGVDAELGTSRQEEEQQN